MGAIAATRVRRSRNFAPPVIVLGLAGLGLVASAGHADVGASLGLLLPATRLSGAAGPLSAPLRPAPSIGLHAGSLPGGGWASPGWDVTLEIAQFESDADRRIRLFWIPLRAGPAWEVATVEGAALTVGASAGGALLTARAGGAASTTGAPCAAVSGRVRRALHQFTVSLGVEAGASWQSGFRPMMGVRIRIDSGGG